MDTGNGANGGNGGGDSTPTRTPVESESELDKGAKDVEEWTFPDAEMGNGKQPVERKAGGKGARLNNARRSPSLQVAARVRKKEKSKERKENDKSASDADDDGPAPGRGKKGKWRR